MSERVNTETGDTLRPVEQRVSIPVGSAVHEFSVWLPRYIAGKLTEEDWQAAGRDLRAHRDTCLSRSVMTGDYFLAGGFERCCEAIQAGMCDLIYERFRQRQIQAGETAWRVPSLLQGKRYAV